MASKSSFSLMAATEPEQATMSLFCECIIYIRLTIMDLNRGSELLKKREDFHLSIRKQITQDGAHRRREQLQKSLLFAIQSDITSQNCFSEATLQSLLSMTQKDQENEYILLGNYMVDYLEETVQTVFDHFKDRTSEKINFAKVVALSMYGDKSQRSQMLQNVHNFVDSQEARVVEYGLHCVEVMCQKMEFESVLGLQNLMRIFREHVFSQDQRVKERAENILHILLNNPEAVESVVTKGADQPLLYLLGLGSKSRIKVINTLEVMFRTLDLMFWNEALMKEVIFIYYTESSPCNTVICSIWENFVTNQPLSRVTALLNLGLLGVICEKLSSPETPVMYITLSTISKLYERLQFQDSRDMLFQVINTFEKNYELSETLLRLKNHANNKISSVAETILDAYYLFDVDDADE